MAAMATPDDKTTSQVKFWTGIVGNVGFPILVAGYLILKVSATLEAINATLARQQTLLETLSRVIEKLQ